MSHQPGFNTNPSPEVPLALVQNTDDASDENNPARSVSPTVLQELAHLDLSKRVMKTTRVVKNGIHADVFKGRLNCADGEVTDVAIKRLRFYAGDDIALVRSRSLRLDLYELTR